MKLSAPNPSSGRARTIRGTVSQRICRDRPPVRASFGGMM